MSKVLCDAVILALKEAHKAYLRQNMEKYRADMKVAEYALNAIRALGEDDGCGRTLELMGLQAEIALLNSLAGVHCPAELIPQYEAAVLQMLLPPSRVVTKDAPMLPRCECTLDFFGGACDRTAECLDRATKLYARLTDGGGGGVSEIYRAQIAQYRGNPEEAAQWAKLAIERMCADRWIEPIALKLIEESGRSRAPDPVNPCNRRE